MRITNLIARQHRLADILREESRMEAALDRVGSGRRVSRPSDDPTAIAELMRTRSQLAELTRRREGVDVVLPGMKASDAALGDIFTSLTEIRSLAIAANNPTNSDAQRQVLADQVGRLTDRIRNLANTESNGQYLFAGTHTDREPFPAGPPVTYAGNSTPLSLSLAAGAPFETSITGDGLLNSRDGTDLFRNLADLQAGIRSGDSARIGAGFTRLDQDLDNMSRRRADVGARTQYVELLRGHLEGELLSARDRQSQLQDVDLATAILEAKTAENAHQATLSVAARLEQTNLLDYLR